MRGETAAAIDAPATATLDRPRRALYILLAIYSLNAMDRNLLALLAEPIKQDLGLSDTQLGLLTGLVFALFYSFTSVPLAWIADRVNRIRVVGIACVSWSVMTACCGLTTNFLQMALARMGVGIGEAGGTAPSMSVVSDYFPVEKRAAALGIFALGSSIGVIVGGSAAALIAAHFGWRAAFFAAGALGFLMAPLLLLVPDPPRGHYDSPDLGSAPTLRATAGLFTRPLIAFLAINAAITAFVGHAILAWTPALLMRSRDMSLTDVGLWYAPTIGVAMAIGTWLGGSGVGHLAKARPSVYGLLPALASLGAIPLLVTGLMVDDWRWTLPMMSLASLLLMIYLAPSLALFHTLIPASVRATGTALFVLFINVFGLGGGPLAMGRISDVLSARGVSEPLEYALLALIPVLLLAAGSYVAMARAIARQSHLTQPSPSRGPRA